MTVHYAVTFGFESGLAHRGTIPVLVPPHVFGARSNSPRRPSGPSSGTSTLCVLPERLDAGVDAERDHDELDRVPARQGLAVISLVSPAIAVAV
jgi:hypothetical protein